MVSALHHSFDLHRRKSFIQPPCWSLREHCPNLKHKWFRLTEKDVTFVVRIIELWSKNLLNTFVEGYVIDGLKSKPSRILIECQCELWETSWTFSWSVDGSFTIAARCKVCILLCAKDPFHRCIIGIYSTNKIWKITVIDFEIFL